MIYRGRIELDKELSFTQSETLRLFFSTKQTKRSYKRAALTISPDGRALQWDRSDDTEYLEQALADTVDLYLKKWGIRANGVITVSGKKRYEIIMLRDKVKTMQDGIIQNVPPSETGQK